jgi:hypothetical protein
MTIKDKLIEKIYWKLDKEMIKIRQKRNRNKLRRKK